jgi:hypothetical protein
MDDRQRDLDRRIRCAQRPMFLRGLWEHKTLIVIGLAMLGLLGGSMAFSSAPDRIEATVTATLVNDGGLVTTRKGSQYHHETVRLETGATIELDVPGADPVRKDAPMRVEIHRRDLGPMHQVTYPFAGYADEPSKS